MVNGWDTGLLLRDQALALKRPLAGQGSGRPRETKSGAVVTTFRGTVNELIANGQRMWQAFKAELQKTLVFAASILSSCFLLSQGQDGTLTITVEPPMPRKGTSVTLKPGTLPENSVSCRWYRGEGPGPGLILLHYIAFPGDTPGAAYTGRETVDASCSLQITNLNTTDSGTYTLTTDGPGFLGIWRAKFEVIDASGSGSGGLSGGAIAGIVLGSLAVMLALTGTLFCFFFRRKTLEPKNLQGGRHQGGKTESPVTPPPSYYENIAYCGQVKTGAGLESSLGTSNTYASILPGHQGEYEQLHWKWSNPPAAGLRI